MHPFKQSQRRRKPVKILFFAGAFVAVFSAITGAVYVLWNMVMPPLFGLSKIGFWQSAGLLALCRLLFGNFGGRRGDWKGGSPGARMKKRWEGMGEEEKAAFRERWRGRCNKG